ncbi:MAG: DUF6445 family protein [Sphingomicrobium sp.]
MKPELLRFGTSQSPVVVVDGFSGSVEDVARLADALAPFPPIAGNYYPGVRRVIREADADAYAYVFETCRQAAPFVGGAFEVDGFDLVEGSFSLVTLQPQELEPVQRAPHFDSPDQNLFALLHYLRVPPGSGTAFFRHRSTGIERVTEATVHQFATAARSEAAKLPGDSGYMHGSDQYYKQIGAVEGIPDRVIIYHSSLLHSGIIPPDMSFSADPSQGRLTANLFLRGR